jgi:hypothetical protein
LFLTYELCWIGDSLEDGPDSFVSKVADVVHVHNIPDTGTRCHIE